MGFIGVYKVAVVQFADSFEMELHIKKDKDDFVAILQDGVLTRSFNKCREVTPLWPGGEFVASCNFNFYNAQVDEWAHLRPPGGYHVGGVEFGGTVADNVVVGTIRFRNGLVSSVYGERIKGVPVVNTSFRTDGIPEGNRYCPCATGSCPHHSFCDSCQIFESLHASQFKGNYLPVIKCLKDQMEKLYGQIESPLIDKHGKDLLVKK